MVFQSLAYFLLMIACLLLMRYVRPVKLRQLILLVFSFYFYAYGSGRQTLLFMGAILLTWLGGMWVDRAQGRGRKIRLSLILLAAFSPLVLYKYLPFLPQRRAFRAGFSPL